MASLDVQRMLTRVEETKAREFPVFMNSPPIKLLISMVPECQPELLQTLLRAAYERGFEIGVSAIVLPLMEAKVKGDL